MLEVDFSDPNDPFAPIAEALFRSFIEDGSIVIEDQGPDEIILEYKALLALMLASEGQLHRISDHRSTLWKRANSEHAEGSPEIAITLYALWIEHTVNGNLISALQRKGYDLELINLIVRELNLRTKITKLWRIAGLDPLEDAEVVLIGQIMEARNGFVHYKWTGHDEVADQSNRERLAELLDRARTLENSFSSRENSLLWNGREEEIINFYRTDIVRHFKEFGPFILGGPSAEGSAEPPTSV